MVGRTDIATVVRGVCVHACVRDVFAIYNNNILRRLIVIMIIIKIISLYFIEIAQTDDFPSTGTRLVNYNIVYYVPLPFSATAMNTKS